MNRCLLYLSFFAALCANAQTYQKRLALVVGNSAYQHGGALPNPVNDAHAIALALQSLGFEVIKHENVTQSQLKQAINQFGQKLRGYEVGLFYYAGHGIQHKGLNYMIPVEADLQTSEQVEFDCVAADRVLAFMETAQAKVNVIIMDACRNNPFERSWNRSTSGNGLAMMNAPSGTLIAYATAPGRVASDGDGANGLYTSALLKNLNNSSLAIEQVFKKVRTEVTEKSNGAQVPWETTSLTGDDFYFASTGLQKGTLIAGAGSTSAEIKSNGQGRDVANTSAGVNEKAKLYLEVGHTAYNEKNFQKAIENYSNAIAAAPGYADAYYWRGHSYYSIQQYPDAIGNYSKAVEYDPSNEQAYYWRGYTNYLLKQYASAVPDYNKAIELNPDVASMYYERANAYYALSNYVEALFDYSKAIELNKSDGNYFYYRGYAYYALGKYREAVDDYSKAMLQLTDPAIGYYRGLAYYYLNEIPSAIADFKSYIERNPHDPYGYSMLGSSYFYDSSYDQANFFLTKAIELDPAVASFYYWRAKVLLELKRKADALRDAEKALQLDPNNESYKSFKNENFN